MFFAMRHEKFDHVETQEVLLPSSEIFAESPHIAQAIIIDSLVQGLFKAAQELESIEANPENKWLSFKFAAWKKTLVTLVDKIQALHTKEITETQQTYLDNFSDRLVNLFNSVQLIQQRVAGEKQLYLLTQEINQLIGEGLQNPDQEQVEFQQAA